MHVSPGPALSFAARGMADAARRLDTAADGVAAFAGEPDAAESPDLVDALVDATVLAPAAYTANAVVARTAAETERTLLDIRA